MAYALSALALALVAALALVWHRAALRAERLRAEIEKERARAREAVERLAQLRAESAESLRQERERHAEELAQERGRWREEISRQAELAGERMRAQFEKESRERADALRAENREQMRALVSPVGQELQRLGEMVARNSTEHTRSAAQLDAALRAVMDNDRRRDESARQLAQALRNRGKVHGDWGEQVLEDILRGSGLREGAEYETQKSLRGDQGQALRPDVVVHFPGGGSAVIDSKVSLTAWADYAGAATDEERAAAARANRESVWAHVMELHRKDYQRAQPGAMPLVLMFVPNEGSYLLALSSDPQLPQKAWARGVLIVNPTNLMLALRLVLASWQNARQDSNCREILALATRIYDKYCLFADTFARLGKQLGAARDTWDKAQGQLREGRGNLSQQVQELARLGAATPRELPPEALPIPPAAPPAAPGDSTPAA